MGGIGINKKTLLGRGGSDYTALFVAEVMGAERCILIKDVNGIYDKDPNQYRDACAYQTLTFQDAVAHNPPIVQTKALKYAAKRNYPFEVRALYHQSGTAVGTIKTNIRKSKKPKKK